MFCLPDLHPLLYLQTLHPPLKKKNKSIPMNSLFSLPASQGIDYSPQEMKF